MTSVSAHPDNCHYENDGQRLDDRRLFISFLFLLLLDSDSCMKHALRQAAP